MKTIVIESNDKEARKYNIAIEWFEVTCKCGNVINLYPNGFFSCSKCGRTYKTVFVVREYESGEQHENR